MSLLSKVHICQLPVGRLFLPPFQEHVGITCAEEAIEDILYIVMHGSFSSMEFSGTSVVLVPGLQGTLRESPNRQIKVVDEEVTMAQEPVHTLAERKFSQRW